MKTHGFGSPKPPLSKIAPNPFLTCLFIFLLSPWLKKWTECSIHCFGCKHARINTAIHVNILISICNDQFENTSTYHQGTNQLLSSVQFLGPWHCSSLSRNADMIRSKGWRTTWTTAIIMKIEIQGLTIIDMHNHNHLHYQHYIIRSHSTRTLTAPRCYIHLRWRLFLS